MRPTLPVVAVALLGLLGAEALAQERPEPPALELPVGARVRLRSGASDQWIKGVLASADAGTISLVPEEAPPLGANRLRLPSAVVTRLEVATGRKRQWLKGLLIGAAAGLAIGADMDVDAERCQFDDNYFCSRGGAVAAMGGTFAGIGVVVGSLIRTDVWTPVALDALGPPSGRLAEPGLQLQTVPGGLGVALSVRF